MFSRHDLADAIHNLQRWEDLGPFITPNDKFYSIAHYGRPAIDARSWSLEISGLVRRPRSFTLAELKARPRRETVFTIELLRRSRFALFV